MILELLFLNYFPHYRVRNEMAIGIQISGGNGARPAAAGPTVTKNFNFDQVLVGGMVKIIIPFKFEDGGVSGAVARSFYAGVKFYWGSTVRFRIGAAFGPTNVPYAPGTMNVNYIIQNLYSGGYILDTISYDPLVGYWYDANTYTTRDTVYMSVKLVRTLGNTWNATFAFYDDDVCVIPISTIYNYNLTLPSTSSADNFKTETSLIASPGGSSYNYSMYKAKYIITSNVVLPFSYASTYQNARADNILAIDSIDYSSAVAPFVLLSGQSVLTDNPVSTYVPNTVAPINNVATTGGVFSDFIETDLLSIADDIGNDMVLTKPNFDTFPWPLKDIGNGVGGVIVDGFNTGITGIIGSLKAIMMSVGYLGDIFVSNTENIIKTNVPRLIGFLKRIISIHAVNPTGNYYEITLFHKVGAALNSTFPGLITHLTAPHTRLSLASILDEVSSPIQKIRIPKQYSVRLFDGMTLPYFDIPDLLILTMFGYTAYAGQSSKVLFSEYGLFNLNDISDRLRSHLYDGTGFTYRELAEDLIEVGGPIIILIIIARILGIDTVKEIIRSSFPAITNKFTPSNSDIYNAIGTEHDEEWNLVGNSIVEQNDLIDSHVLGIPLDPLLTDDTRLQDIQDSLDAIPTDVVLSNDSRLDNLDSPLSETSKSTDMVTMLTRMSISRAANMDLLPILNTLGTSFPLLQQTINLIPNNPVLDNDDRMDIITNLNSWLAKWVVYLSNPMTTKRPDYPT